MFSILPLIDLQHVHPSQELNSPKLDLLGKKTLLFLNKGIHDKTYFQARL